MPPLATRPSAHAHAKGACSQNILRRMEDPAEAVQLFAEFLHILREWDEADRLRTKSSAPENPSLSAHGSANRLPQVKQ